MARALGVNIISTFDSKGISKAIRDFKKLEGAGNKATFGLRTVDKAFTNGAKNIAKYGGLLAGGLGAAALYMVKGAELAKQADDRLVAVAKSMGLFGDASQQVTGRLIKLADAQEYELGVTAETIKLTQAKLMTFKELAVTAGEVGAAFDRATVAAVDLAASGFGEASQNATQLGKALNDPIKGITALARSGVTFTAQEKEKIKVLVESGKMLEAQDTLLKAIETQVGGTAAATVTDTFKISMAFGHIRDVIGTLLLPIFEKLANFMVNTVVPYATKVEEAFGEQGVAGGLKFLGQGFLNVIEDGGKFVNILLILTAAFVAMRLVAIAATIAQNLFNVALLNNPIGRVVAILIVLGVAVVAAYLKFEGFRTVVHTVANSIIGFIEKMVNIWIKGFNLIIFAINILIKAANFFGAGLPELGKIGEVSFGRIGSAARKANTEISKTIGMIQAAKNAERMGVVLTPKYSGSGDDEFGGGTGGGKGESAIEKAKKALEKYTDAIKGVTSAQKSLREANKQLGESNKSLLEKTQALAQAQKLFNLITNGYGKDSKQAKNADNERSKSQRTLERANYGLEQAVFAVKDAEKALADLRKDPEATPQRIREAEIGLAEAKLSVADATDSQQESTQALTEAQLRLDEAINGAKEGSETYTDALKELQDAQKAEVDATDAVTAALERQTDAVEKLADAEEKRRDAGKDVPKDARKAADAIANAVVVVADAVKTVSGGGVPAVAAIASGITQSVLDQLNERRGFVPSLTNGFGGGGGGVGGGTGNEMFAFAKGGIVTSPMIGMVGESGAEAIIPLDRLGNMGNTYNISVTAGMGADGKDIGTQIVNALKRYERTNGSIPISVA